METTTWMKSYQRWGFAGTLVWGILIIMAFIFIQLVAMGIYIGFYYGEVPASELKKLIIDLQDNGAVLSLCTFATTFTCIPLIFGIIKLKQGSNTREYLGLKHVELKIYCYWLLVILIFIILSDSLTTVLGRPIVPEFMLSVYTSIERVWILWLAIIVAAPIFEELFFRGFLLSGFSATLMGSHGAVLLTSLLWAGIHFQYDYYDLFTIFLLGLILGIARLKTGSVLLTIVLHSFINLIATIETMIHVSLSQV